MAERKKNQYVIWIVAIILISSICVVFNHIYDGKFLTMSNISILVSHAVMPAFVAWGMAYTFACDITDMSLGGVIIISANVAGFCGLQFGLTGVILGGVLSGILLVVFNYVIFVVTKIPSWIAGIGLAMVYEAIAVFYSNSVTSVGNTLPQLTGNLRVLASAPYIYIIFILGIVLEYVIYNRTQVGFNIRALGSGVNVAKNIGIKIGKTR